MYNVSYGLRPWYQPTSWARDWNMFSRYTSRPPTGWNRYFDYSTRRPGTSFFSRGSGASYRDPHSGATFHVYGSGGTGGVTYGDRILETPWSTGDPVTPTPPSRPDFSNVLAVKHVDLMVAENSLAHHTDRYEISQPDQKPSQLVIRRGQPFSITIDFTKEYNPEADDLKLVFEAGDNPKSVNGTYVEFILSEEDLPKQWGAKIVSQEGTKLIISVLTPPTLYVGKWELSVDTVKKADNSVAVYKYGHNQPIYIIFNPWCEDDAVYMDEESLKEYVLKDTGFVYMGTKDSISEKPWNFGQFESVILDCAIYLLDHSGLKWEVRGNPALIVRKLSALMNSNDDNGVVTGKWSEPYTDGRSPLSWTGSVKILEKYWETKAPVKYGQCWVFSGVLTTVCRTLGIPTRSVSNFMSAHDTDGSVTIDSIYDAQGNPIDHDDSVWNFHVWNEAWMARPDLPEGFGGWQAFDSTPQEVSDGVFCCGPASVEAIKQGNIHLPYDGAFVFAEVNADRLSWMPNFTGKLRCIDCQKHEIGKYISTKAANTDEREDVTSNYKSEEGSAEERAAVIRANQLGSNRPDIYRSEQDVHFRLEHDPQNTWMGSDFDVLLRITNGSDEVRTVKGRMVVSSMYYTGQLGEQLKMEPFEGITLTPGQDVEVKVKLTAQEYDGKLKDCCMLKMSVWASAVETGQVFTSQPTFRLRKPHLTVNAPKVVGAGTEFEVEVSFLNPLATTLTGCYVEIDGLAKPLKFRVGTVAPKGTFMTTLPIVPKKIGQTTLILVFNSDQLEDINTSLTIFIKAV
ncbi:hypothetical protein RRG08_027078 [Elysia crispata]|uniref:protein-glutamine gamma-glutamyltransferase n=1 Tax=Elysia crispata TaxID=231223 RepID=A0AAE0ZHI0_9GAST|nr:hypothetical protein RRG08_027078 [Elysia crispata]